MKKRSKKTKKPSQKSVRSLSHPTAKRKNIPTAQLHPFMPAEQQTPMKVKIKRPNAGLSPALKKAVAGRDEDCDPQLVWKGKIKANPAELTANAPALYIQEKVHPKVLIDDLARRSQNQTADQDPDLFENFNGLPRASRAEFYRHEGNWQNRMILGDSLQVMTSLCEREGLHGRVQAFYFDPPYGIKFNSNFQWSTTSRASKDGETAGITREPEQVKAFRDTWRHGVHSYLNYIRDRLTIAHQMLHKTGRIFLQIGDENVHRMRALLDEVFGDENFVSLLVIKKGGMFTSKLLSNTCDFILWFAKDKTQLKYRQLYEERTVGVSTGQFYDKLEFPDGSKRSMTREEKRNPNSIPDDARPFQHSNPCSQHESEKHRLHPLMVDGKPFFPPMDRQWSSAFENMHRLVYADRLIPLGRNLGYKRFIDDFAAVPVNNLMEGALLRTQRVYIVETAPKVIQRCVLMATDPGDLVIDPTCGSGTTAYVCEQFGRRWIVIDTSRVALALARARMMGAQFPYYKLAANQPK